MRLAIRALLSSSHFMYRSEIGQDTGGGVYRLTGHEAASALSYMFWATMPDDELLAAADSGELDTAEVSRPRPNADQLSRKYAKLLRKVGGQEIQALSGRVERQRGMREQVHASQCSSRKYRHLSPT